MKEIVEGWLDRLYIAAEGAGLRDEDRKKALEGTALLGEIAQAVRRLRRERELILVDAAAGKAYVGLLAAQLVLQPAGRHAKVITLERDPARLAAVQAAGARLMAPNVTFEHRVADVGDASAWPDEPSLVVALHACGAASDLIIERAIAARARILLLVPCCYGMSFGAQRFSDRLGIPRHAPVRRRFAQAIIDAERTLRLEAAGWQTEVVEMCPPTVTPHNLLWRARRVGEPGRAADAAARLAKLS